MILTRAQALGVLAFFAAEGSAYANDSINSGNPGVVDVNHAPASNDAAFLPVGTIEEWEDKKTVKDVLTYGPSPSVLTPKRKVRVSQEMSYNFTTNELTPLALQLYYAAAETLVQNSNSMTPLAGKLLHGFLLLQKTSTEGDQANPYFVGLIWVALDVTGGMKGGENIILKPTFEAVQMFSTLNKVQMLQAN